MKVKGQRHYLFTKVERDILVLDHMHNLALHSQEKQYHPITEKDGPKYRDVKQRKESH